MNEGGITTRLVNFAKLILGHFRAFACFKERRKLEGVVEVNKFPTDTGIYIDVVFQSVFDAEVLEHQCIAWVCRVISFIFLGDFANQACARTDGELKAIFISISELQWDVHIQIIHFQEIVFHFIILSYYNANI